SKYFCDRYLHQQRSPAKKHSRVLVFPHYSWGDSPPGIGVAPGCFHYLGKFPLSHYNEYPKTNHRVMASTIGHSALCPLDRAHGPGLFASGPVAPLLPTQKQVHITSCIITILQGCRARL